MGKLTRPDALRTETALELARLTCPHVDILEAGTPLIKTCSSCWVSIRVLGDSQQADT